MVIALNKKAASTEAAFSFSLFAGVVRVLCARYLTRPPERAETRS